MGATTIVYNGLNHEALLAAAVVKAEITDSVAIDIHRAIPQTSEEYIWIGIDPFKKIPTFREFKGKKNTVIVSGTSAVQQFSEENVDVQTRCSLIQQAINVLGLSSEFQKLAFLAGKFHDKYTCETQDEKDEQEEMIAWIYGHLVQAQHSLHYNTVFEQRSSITSGIEQYREKVNQIRQSMARSFYILEQPNHDGRRKVFYTAYNDFSYHLVLRLARLAHEYFLNVSMGLHGPLAYTNLPTLDNFRLNDNLIIAR